MKWGWSKKKREGGMGMERRVERAWRREKRSGKKSVEWAWRQGRKEWGEKEWKRKEEREREGDRMGREKGG